MWFLLVLENSKVVGVQRFILFVLLVIFCVAAALEFKFIQFPLVHWLYFPRNNLVNSAHINYIARVENTIQTRHIGQH